MEAPRLEKITLNIGIGEASRSDCPLEAATEQLATITGQQPSVRRARKSIASFKIREGMPVGVAVTLRRARMWEFLDRLISIAIPRIRDFRGLSPRSFDGRGNYSLGIREQLIFPEIDYDSIDEVRGLDVTITTTARTDEEAFELLRAAGHAVLGRGPARARRTPRPPPRRSGARRRRASAPRPSRLRSSSSRRRTPRPTSARSREEDEEGEEGRGRSREPEGERPKRGRRASESEEGVDGEDVDRSSAGAKAEVQDREPTTAASAAGARAPTTASSGSAGCACATPRTRATSPG